MSDQPKLGTILDDSARRDAIHVAIAPVVAKVRLYAGQHVGLLPDGLTVAPQAAPLIGIIDPFLIDGALPGDRCWLFLYPNTVTSLRHVWTHPAFGDEAASPASATSLPEKKAASEKWLRDFCERADCPDYETVMQLIDKGTLPKMEGYSDRSRIGEDYLLFVGYDAHGEIPPEFWVHAEIVLGRSIPQKPSHFSCSC